MPLMDDAITVIATGAKITTSGVSTSIAIPLDFSGNIPRYIRVGATAPACIRIGGAGVTATTNDTQLQPGDSQMFTVNFQTTIAAIQVSGPGQVQISPLENI